MRTFANPLEVGKEDKKIAMKRHAEKQVKRVVRDPSFFSTADISLHTKNF